MTSIKKSYLNDWGMVIRDGQAENILNKISLLSKENFLNMI